MKNRGGQQVIERILTAYGFTSRQEYCNHLGISQSTMANRYARDTFPADWIVICSIETGAAIEWLAFGNESGSSQPHSAEACKTHAQNHLIINEQTPLARNPIEIKINPNQGGKAAIERLVDAYGFKTRQALAEHLRVSKSTLANRYLRDTFPSDWIIQCSLETGTSLNWLTTGNGPRFTNQSHNIIALENRNIVDGKLSDIDFYHLDRSWIPDDLIKPICITTDDKVYILESNFNDVNDGNWLVEVEGKISIRHLTRIPVGKIKVRDTQNCFECLIDDISILAKCKCVFDKKYNETFL
ncbi:phage repressor protein CI [Enterobacter bugandensis]|uniref:phage repressor protein CI n=1 Tax=Enterobacter bugandensis TaxID=881260 RepID=UPI003754587F